jgi:hypothetical protein
VRTATGRARAVGTGRPTSFRITDEILELFEEIKRYRGLKPSAALEYLIRAEFRRIEAEKRRHGKSESGPTSG